MLQTLQPSALYTHRLPEGKGSGPSSRIAAILASASHNPDGSSRRYDGDNDDFAGVLDAGAGGTGTVGRYRFAKDTGGTLVSDLTIRGGWLKGATAATLNDGITLKSGPGGYLETLPLFFESRLKLPSNGEVFVGITAAATSTSTDGILADGGGLIQTDLMGFHIVNGSISFKSGVTGQAAVTLADNLATVSTDGTHSLGFVFSRKPVTSTYEKLNVFIDNNMVGNIPATSLSDNTKVPLSDPYAETPVLKPLASTIAVKNNAGAAMNISIDWLYCHSLMP